MVIKDEVISKGTMLLSLATATPTDTIATIISITSAVVSIAYTLYKAYARFKKAKTDKERLQILAEAKKDLEKEEIIELWLPTKKK